MEQYIKAVRRKLNLPKEVRDRVMNDFASSVAARQEAGETEEQIIAELGTPKQAAAELNEQMKEYAYVKSHWRWAALGAAVLGIAMLAFHGVTGFLTYLLNLSYNEASCVGIIGGADGPTAIFVTSSWTPEGMIPWVVLVVMGILGFRKLSRCRQK